MSPAIRISRAVQEIEAVQEGQADDIVAVRKPLATVQHKNQQTMKDEAMGKGRVKSTCERFQLGLEAEDKSRE